jgi:hypothetical protein
MGAMQILYAAPFLLLAALVFSVLSVVPRARRWAIPIPTGILGAGAFALVGFGAVAFWINLSGPRPMGRGFLIPFFTAGALSGLLGGVLTWFIARWVASILSAILLRGGVCCGMVQLLRGAGRRASLGRLSLSAERHKPWLWH